MPTINIEVKNKVARQTNDEMYVCGNSDFVIAFSFDAEWDEYAVKTARFRYNGNYQEVAFTGNECPVPVIHNTNNIQIGMYAGDLHTTTAAVVLARKSILCGEGVHDAPPEDVYNQLMDLLQQVVSDEQIESVVEQYMAAHPYEGVTEEQLNEVVGDALTAAKESGEFDGDDGYTPIKGVDYFDGKDGYTPVKGKDYFDGVNGKDGQDGYSPVRGTDYWTETDKSQMVSDVIAALPLYEGEVETL